MFSKKIFENIAVSNWQLAVSQKAGTWFLVLGLWLCVTTLCRLGLGLGLGDAWVTQGPPKRHARATQGSIDGLAFVFNKS
jgi:hypothetical protein